MTSAVRRWTTMGAVGFLLAVAGLAGATGRAGAGAACTHGASSIGPVVLRDGAIVAGDAVPRTDACLR